MSPANDQLTEVQMIERALAHLVIEACQVATPWPSTRKGRTFSDATSSASTRAQEAADDLLDNPVREALGQAISTLGVRLHEIGGFDLMIEVSERINEPHRAEWGATYIDLMDRRWDGIGAGSPDRGWLR